MEKDRKAFVEWQERVKNPGFWSAVTGRSNFDSQYAASHPTPGAINYMNHLNSEAARREAEERQSFARSAELRKQQDDFLSRPLFQTEAPKQYTLFSSPTQYQPIKPLEPYKPMTFSPLFPSK